jgi:hypothetical protein
MLLINVSISANTQFNSLIDDPKFANSSRQTLTSEIRIANFYTRSE